MASKHCDKIVYRMLVLSSSRHLPSEAVFVENYIDLGLGRLRAVLEIGWNHQGAYMYIRLWSTFCFIFLYQ